MTREKYPVENLKVLKLDNKALIPYLHTWSLTLRPFVRWGECGHAMDETLGWMFFHNLMLVGQSGKFGSNVLVDPTTHNILGVASRVPDDHGVQTQLRADFGVNPTGFLGGIYIKDQLQGKGLGSYLCSVLDAEVQAWVNQVGADEEWYLFTRNPFAAAIYTALGFEEFQKDWHIKACDTRETVYRKVYSRNAKPRFVVVDDA
jgi:GNAT superfamily N-acetyltransferase